MNPSVFLKINSQDDIHIKSWQYWCKNNNVDLIPVKEKSEIKLQLSKYEKVAWVNSNVLIKWNAPNIFDTFEDDICGVIDTSDFKKIITNIEKFNLNPDYYLNTDVLFFNTKYSDIIEDTFEDEQTSINYNINKFNKLPKFLYPSWNLYSIHIKDMFKHNWQLNIDNIPTFIKYAYVWNLNDLPTQYKNKTILEVWNYIKDNYN